MNEQHTVLLTNDDGAASPLLLPFARVLSKQPWCARVVPVVPAREQSWMAQAMTRFCTVSASERTFGDFQGFAVAGTPADCVSIGVHNLLDNPPRYVFSGINIGTNAGLAFYLSSGTVGAARQGFLSRTCAVAFSVCSPKDVSQAWIENDQEKLISHQSDWERIAKVCAKVANTLVAKDAWAYADLFTVNLPWLADVDTPLALTRLEPCYYGRVFTPVSGGVFQHDFCCDSMEISQNGNNGDISALSKGYVTVTPIRYNLGLDDPEAVKYLTASISYADQY